MLFKPSLAVAPLYLGGPVSVVQDVLATALDTEVVLTNLSTGEQLGKVEPDGETVTALALTPDLATLIVATRSLQISLYSLEDLRRYKTFPKAHESSVLAMTVDSTSSLLATGGAEGAVKVWDLEQGFVTHNFRGHGGLISALKFYGQLHGSDWRLISGSDDGVVRVWDLAKSKSAAVLTNHTNVVRGIDISSSGDVILSAGRDKVVSLWNDYKLIATLPILQEVEAAGFVLGKYFYTGVPSGVKLWTLQGTQVAEWSIPHDEAQVIDIVRMVGSLHEGSESLLLVLSDQTMVVFDVSEVAEEPRVGATKYIAGNNGEIIDLISTNASGSEKVVLATNSQDLRVVALEKPLEFVPLVGHTDIVVAIDVLGNWLVSAGKDKEARLWDLTTGECKIVFTGHAGSIGAVSLSRGSHVPKFVLTGSQDLTIKKWGPDGSAEYTRKAHDKDINSLDVSHDNKLFASGSQDRTAKIWDVDTGEVRGVLRGHRRGVWCVKFGPDKTVVTSSGDKTVRLWNLNDFTTIRTFEGHLNSVLKVAFLNDQYLASAGGDGLVKIWEVSTSENVATLDNHDEKVWSLAVTKSSKLISGGGDGVLTVWDDYTEQETARIQQEQEEQVELQQELDNTIRSEQWDKAIRLALKLNHPLRLLKLFTQVSQNAERGSITGKLEVDEVIAGIEGKDLARLLERVRSWNTNTRTAPVAQAVLAAILRSRTQSEFLKPQVYKALDGILPYSERHMARYDELLESSYALRYMLEEMTL